MSYITLSRPGIYVPPSENPRNVITNDDLERIVMASGEETSDEWIFSRTGIKERRISNNLGVKEMAIEAVRDLLNKTDLNSEEIDEIIFATNRHDNEQEFRNHAGYVAERMGVRKRIPFYDIGAGCTGLIYAIRQACNNLMQEDKRKIIVIGSERLTDMTDYSDRTTCILFGDGAGAFSLEKHDGEGEGIIKNVVAGEPDVNNFLTLEKKKGKKLKLAGPDVPEKFEIYEAIQNYLVMTGNKVFEFATDVMKSAVHDVLEGTGYSIGDIKVIIPHGANQRIIEAAEKRLKAKGFMGELFTNLEKYGNTSTASIPLAISEANEKGIIKNEDLYILVGFGAGFTYGASLVRHSV